MTFSSHFYNLNNLYIFGASNLNYHLIKSIRSFVNSMRLLLITKTNNKTAYAVLLISIFFFKFTLFAQDSNIKYPVEIIEQMLLYDPVEIVFPKDIRFEGDKAKTAILKRDDGFSFRIKFKKAPIGGQALNNQPRYEIAAYKLQKLFLKPNNFVVPPTAGRGFPLDVYKKLDPNVIPTFKGTSSVFCVIQYWLHNVKATGIFDEKLFDSDTLYAKHLANFNILTYLIKHNDSNIGNILISSDPTNPRIFAVDNGIAFGEVESPRGYEWRNIRINRLPRESIDALRQYQYRDLVEELGVVAQYRFVNDQLIPMVPKENFNDHKGVRTLDDMFQLGLTASEIKEVYERLKKLLQKVDSGEYRTY